MLSSLLTQMQLRLICVRNIYGRLKHSSQDYKLPNNKQRRYMYVEPQNAIHWTRSPNNNSIDDDDDKVDAQMSEWMKWFSLNCAKLHCLTCTQFGDVVSHLNVRWLSSAHNTNSSNGNKTSECVLRWMQGIILWKMVKTQMQAHISHKVIGRCWKIMISNLVFESKNVNYVGNTPCAHSNSRIHF